MARDFARRAVEALGVLPDLGDRQTLGDLTEYILERRRLYTRSKAGAS